MLQRRGLLTTVLFEGVVTFFRDCRVGEDQTSPVLLFSSSLLFESGVSPNEGAKITEKDGLVNTPIDQIC